MSQWMCFECLLCVRHRERHVATMPNTTPFTVVFSIVLSTATMGQGLAESWTLIRVCFMTQCLLGRRSSKS